MNFEQKLKMILKKNDKFVDKEGDLIKSVIINSATKLDKELIILLIKDKEIKNAFFEKIEDLWIFNINNFVAYIQDKNVFSNSVTKFEAKIGLNIDNKFLGERGEVALVWPFKDCVLEGSMTKEDQKRDEIFFNEILAKDEIDRLEETKVLTNFKKYSSKGEEKVKDFIRDESRTIKDNLVIKGNNLLALHSLKKVFSKKVKMIYIDPPYNKKADTFYNDNFKHSTWLTFMKNRLEIAKDLLRDDGSIFISIDDTEQAYLKILMNGIFGDDNFIAQFIVVSAPAGTQGSADVAQQHSYCIAYKKSSSFSSQKIKPSEKELNEKYNEKDSIGRFYTARLWKRGVGGRKEDVPSLHFPVYYDKKNKKIFIDEEARNKKGLIKIIPYQTKGVLGRWTWSKTKMKKDRNKLIVKKVAGKYRLHKKKYVFEEIGKLPYSIIGPKIGRTELGSLETKKILGSKEFNYPKSSSLIKYFIKISTDIKSTDIIMDFFAGSGTTGHAVIDLNKEDGGNRKFILIEQLDKHMNVIKKKLKRVLEKNKQKEKFIYCELMKYNEEAIDKIQGAKDTKTLLKIWKEMCDKYFLNYDVDIKKFNDNRKEFENLTLKQQKKELVKMLNKNQLYVNLSEIEDSQFKVSKKDKELNKKFYNGD